MSANLTSGSLAVFCLLRLCGPFVSVRRNDTHFNNICTEPTVKSQIFAMEKFQAFMSEKEKTTNDNIGLIKWCFPPAGNIKLN